jgi:tetratricopeptide (TPR) repeat protein
MKLLLSACFVLFFFGCSFAKTNETTPKDSVTGIVDKSAALLIIDKGKQLLTEGKVRDALLVFREAGIKDPYQWKAAFWTAYCHYKLNNFGYSRQYCLEAIRKGGSDVDNDIYEILGASYHRLGELDSAQLYYQKAFDLLPKSRAKELGIEKKLAECAFAKNALKKTSNIRQVVTGDINSGYNDYAPVLTADGKQLYFTSRRANTTGGRMNPDDQEYFEDVYRAVWNENTKQWDSITNEIERMNTDGHDALTWISKNGLNAVITWNNTATEDKVLTKSGDICEIEFTKKMKWAPAKPIANKTINTTYFEGSATLTADGNTMYFVSDRKGDKRSTDIYMVQKVGKKWGNAVVLSDSINTTGRETTPFITPDGRFLFFSSDGHRGMGGLDVYVSENTGYGWSTPINLGAAINTVNDDTHFKIYKEFNKVYMAGINLSGQKSSFDIYEIDLSALKLPVEL